MTDSSILNFGKIISDNIENFTESVRQVARIIASVPAGEDRDRAFSNYKDVGPTSSHVVAVNAAVKEIDRLAANNITA